MKATTLAMENRKSRLKTNGKDNSNIIKKIDRKLRKSK